MANFLSDKKISATRLIFVPATPEHIIAELEEPKRMAALLNAEIDPGWPPGEYDRGAQEFFLERLSEGGKTAAGWYIWYAICRPNKSHGQILAGAGGYFGPPDENGMVEIGFSVIPALRNMGYATEIAVFLVENAFTESSVVKVTARTTVKNPASCRVLRKACFKETDIDNESGTITFEINKNS